MPSGQWSISVTLTLSNHSIIKIWNNCLG